MSLPVFCDYYKLSPQELKEILKRHNIDSDLKFVQEVPEKWNEIVSKELNLPPIKSVGAKAIPISTTSNNHDLVTEKLNSLEELGKLKKSDSHNLSIPRKKRSNTQKNKNKKDCFFVYVKYIAPDNSHAFVKKIDDINEIGTIDLRSKENSLKVYNGLENLSENQVVLASEVSTNIVEIEEHYFQGFALKAIGNFKITGGKRDAFSINNNLRFKNDFPDTVFITVKFTYRIGVLWCDPTEIEGNQGDPILKLEGQAERIFQKKELNEEDRALINLYKSHAQNADFDDKLWKQFQIEIDLPAKLDPDQQFTIFLSKWLFLKSEWVNIETFRHLEKLNLYFISWLDSTLPVSFFKEHLIDACIQYEQAVNYKSEDQKLSFSDSLNEAHLETIGKAIIADKDKTLLIDSFEVFNAYKALIEVAKISDKDFYFLKIRGSVNPDLQFELWLEDENIGFPKEEAIIRFDSQAALVQERILDELGIEDIIPLIPKLKQINSQNTKSSLIEWAGNLIQESFSAVSFDIESDTQSIFEIAWNEGGTWSYFQGEGNVDEILPKFSEVTSNTKNLILGHNIIEFDCPILKKKDVKFNEEQIWDTLLVEMALQPYLKSFALSTGHKAEKDAKVTLDLFKNQVLRLLKSSEEDLKVFNDIFPSKILEVLSNLRRELSLNWLQIEDLENTEVFFRKQSSSGSQFYNNVSEAISKSKLPTKFILGPKVAKREFLDYPGICFINDNNEQDYLLLDLNKIKELGANDAWVKQVLQQFVEYSIYNNQKPYWGRLSTAVQLKITEKIHGFDSLLEQSISIDWNSTNLLFVTVEDLFELKSNNLDIPMSDFLVIHSDLISVSNKTCLREVNLDFIISLDLDNHFWMKFSGGQSFVEISKEECKLLEVNADESFSNFWIEKYQFSKFRIWGNYDWEKLLDDFKVNSKTFIEADKVEEGKEKKYFAKINLSPQQGKEIIRFNPESIYRSRYWVFQKELIWQAMGQGEPSVLLIQQQKEIESLETYFRSLGYYIPDGEASMGRRLEMLHTGYSGKRLIIDTLSNLDAILKANHSDSLTIFVDSFNLKEKYFIAKNSIFFKNLVKKHILGSSEEKELAESNSEEIVNEYADIDKIGIPLVKDTFFHLKLEKPLMTYYSDMIFSNNPDNILWILDPRISDYPEFGKEWGAKIRSLSLWKDYSLYEEDVEQADKHIHSPKPLEELPFSLEESKKILSSVFLQGNDWYDYQEPCLDDILPAKEDVMVSLPTGGGKSLLFQAPALFRSTFTNRLSLVITPLKALMEDQVDNLWNLGFYGSVEYLNSDRNTDTPLIYRALAGGEISLLYITPERFRSRAFLNALEVRMQSDGGLEYAIFDEAHCVSQWGHEFRPDYFNAANYIKHLRISNRIPLLLFSATVSEKIFNDFKSIFDVKETVPR